MYAVYTAYILVSANYKIYCSKVKLLLRRVAAMTTTSSLRHGHVLLFIL